MKEIIKKIIIILIIVAVTITIDQISKNIIERKIPLYAFVDIIGNFFQLRHIVNRGFINSLGSRMNDGSMFNGVVIITIPALLILIGYFIFLIKQKKYLCI